MTTVIVEYDAHDRANLKRLAAMVNDLTVVAEFSGAWEAFRNLETIQADMIMLNIDSPDRSGLELAGRLKGYAPLFVFIASGNYYAAEAFDLDVADYLLKPLSGERFFRAIDKVRDRMRYRNPLPEEKEEHLFIRDATILRRLRLDDVLFAEAMGDYVKLYTRQRMYCIHVRFGTVEERLPAARFVRVHRSFIVALDKVDKFQDGGVFIGEQYIPVTETYRKALINRIRVI